jgi:hypothetical protein
MGTSHRIDRGKRIPRKKSYPRASTMDRRLSWVAELPELSNVSARNRKDPAKLKGPRRPVRSWDKTLDRLREKPGSPAIIARGTESQVSNLYSSLRRRPDAAEFDYRTGGRQDGMAKLYAMYLGEGR